MRRTGIGLLVALVAMTSAQARADEPVAGEQRERYLAALAIRDEPLRRHLLADQKLVVWLPERFAPVLRVGGTQAFGVPGKDIELRLIRQELTPGMGLTHLVDGVVKELSRDGIVQKELGRRQTRVAGRPAVELLAEMTVEGVPRVSRVVTAIDPGDEHYRSIVLHCRPAANEECDALLLMLLRDLTPLDRVAWNGDIETLRSEMSSGVAARLQAKGNEALAAIAEPAAIGRPWVAERLNGLGGEAPVLLLDGLLHHHPRVREACLDALMPRLEKPEQRATVLAAALRDPDPVVRHRAAMLVATDQVAAPALLMSALSADEPAARSGAFQLLAVMDRAARTELLRSAAGKREQLPPASQRLLVLALGEWGGDDTPQILLRIWTRSTDERLRRVAGEELLRRGHARALEAARKQLGGEAASAGFDVGMAARFLAVYADAGSTAADWERLVKDLERPQPSESPRAKRSREQAAETMQSFSRYLRVLPSPATARDECLELRHRFDSDDVDDWERDRFRRFASACELESRPGEILRAVVAHPGALLVSYGDLLDRVDLGTAEPNQLFRALLSHFPEQIEETMADPILRRSEMSRVSGIDFTAPWQWRGRAPVNPGGVAFADKGDLDMPFAMTVQCHDPQQLVRVLVRGFDGAVTLGDVLAVSGLAVAAMPLAPALLGEVWEEQRRQALGEDEAFESSPSEAHVALVEQRRADATTLYTFHRIALSETRPATRTVSYLLVDKTAATLLGSTDCPIDLAPEPAVPVVGEAPDVRIELDLGAALRGTTELQVDKLAEGLRATVVSAFDGRDLTTSFEIGELPLTWRGVARQEAPTSLRAPATVLGADTMAWAIVTFDPPALVRGLREKLPANDPQLVSLLDLVASSSGEAGVALAGLPELAPGSKNDWEQEMVAFISVPADAAARFLKQVMPDSRVVSGVRIAVDGSHAAVHRSGFLLMGTTAERLGKLATGPRLAGSPFFKNVIARMPPTAAVIGALNVDAPANAILAGAPEDAERWTTVIGTEFLRALGPVVAFATQKDDRVLGAVSIRPRLMTEEAQARVRRLVGYPGYMAGSIPVEGFPAEGPDEIHQMQVTLEVADATWAFPARWANERQSVERLAAGQYRIVSRTAPALPESSNATLPITGDLVAPYLREEEGLEVHAAQIRALAEEIRGQEKDPARIIRSVMAWVKKNVDYKVVRDSSGAAETLSTRQADCSEFAQLTVAVCRALGIPARATSGMVVDQDAAILHAWVEVYVDRWYEIDPTSGRTQVPASYIATSGGDAFLLASVPGCRLVVESIQPMPARGGVGSASGKR